jgi:putative glutamine amidotransferase
MGPLIGIFTSERHAGHPGEAPSDVAPATHMRLGLTYLRAIEAAGGMPVVLAPDAPERAVGLVERLDGLCLAGGPDLDPLHYGAAERHALLGPTDFLVDDTELALLRAADEHGLPILGICRGLQALNVARGGTLVQHVDDHRQDHDADAPLHPVRVAPGSLLARVCGTAGAGALEVNSFHHQAAGRLGDGLRAVAWAPDGTVEAVEDPGRPLVLGVQWHAESMIGRPQQLALFHALVDASAAAPLRLAA